MENSTELIFGNAALRHTKTKSREWADKYISAQIARKWFNIFMRGKVFCRRYIPLNSPRITSRIDRLGRLQPRQRQTKGLHDGKVNASEQKLFFNLMSWCLRMGTSSLLKEHSLYRLHVQEFLCPPILPSATEKNASPFDGGDLDPSRRNLYHWVWWWSIDFETTQENTNSRRWANFVDDFWCK